MTKSPISEPQFRAFGSSAILVEWEQRIDEYILYEVLMYKKKLHSLSDEEILYINHAYNSILINYVSTIENINDKILSLKRLNSTNDEPVKIKFSTWEIPVCYDEKFGVDLLEISESKKLAKNQIIEMHSESTYLIYFIGFLPGFLYMGGLPDKLHHDRKPSPRINVKKGSVAIGGNQSGIYPSDSPGGWNIIGSSPVDFFDTRKQMPCFAEAGDKIRFRPISMVEHELIRNEVDAGVFEYNSIQIND